MTVGVVQRGPGAPTIIVGLDPVLDLVLVLDPVMRCSVLVVSAAYSANKRTHFCERRAYGRRT
jgi:hypothetical protein